jgi:nucleoside-diphosphate-sugar epimerase
MPKIAVTGAFGSVGGAALRCLLAEGAAAVAVDLDTPRNRRAAARWRRDRLFRKAGEVRWADIREPSAVAAALAGVDAVIHLAAVLPPLADHQPDLARSVNVEGTRTVAAACAAMTPEPRLVYASSIAIYGDHVGQPWIDAGQPLEPNDDDAYAKSKIEAEAVVRSSGLRWAILRLTYIVDSAKLKLDPIFFKVPLATSLEILHRDDAGRAFAHAALTGAADGKTLDIGGGEACRTNYRAYLGRMFRAFGLGGLRLPDAAFASSGFHCGWFSDSDLSERLLAYRDKTQEDFYRETARAFRFVRPWLALARPIAFRFLRRWAPVPAPGPAAARTR